MGQNNALHRHLNHGFGGVGGIAGPVSLETDREMKVYRWARGTGLQPTQVRVRVRVTKLVYQIGFTTPF